MCQDEVKYLRTWYVCLSVSFNNNVSTDALFSADTVRQCPPLQHPPCQFFCVLVNARQRERRFHIPAVEILSLGSDSIIDKCVRRKEEDR
jgi:hypothetical protein